MNNFMGNIDTTGYGKTGLYGQATTGRSLIPTNTGNGSGFSLASLNPLGWFGGDKEGDENSLNSWGNIMSGAGALGSAWMGMKQYGLAKDQLAESKRQFNKNFATQTKMTNTQLQDRQRARVASNPQAYQSVSSYMKKNGV